MAGLLGADDEEQLAHALLERRALVTHDPDLIELAHRDQAHAVIAYCDQERRSLRSIVQSLLLIWEVLSPEEMEGHTVQWRHAANAMRRRKGRYQTLSGGDGGADRSASRA